MQTTPRFVKAGGGNQRVSTASSFLQSVVLTSKTGAASLSIYNTATSTINVTLNNRLFLSVNPASGPRTATLELGEGALFLTGMTASLNGAGARAVLFVSDRTRGQ